VAVAAIGVIALSGCSGSIEIGRPRQSIVAPAGDTVIEPNGTVIEPPREAAIETVLTGLSQAQSVRTLTRQLAR
jgi:hypothetical protein